MNKTVFSNRQLLGLGLYIVATFILYSLFDDYFQSQNCSGVAGGLGNAGYNCYGYYYLYEKLLFPSYLFFLWMSVILYFFISFKLSGTSFTKKSIVMIVFVTFILFLNLANTFFITPTNYQGLPLFR